MKTQSAAQKKLAKRFAKHKKVLKFISAFRTDATKLKDPVRKQRALTIADFITNVAGRVFGV